MNLNRKMLAPLFLFLFFYQYQWVGNWKLEARIPINIFCLNFVSIVWTSNEIKYCPALTMNVKNNRGWCRNFKLDLMKSTTNISANFSMGMDGIVIFMYRMVQWIYIKKNVTKFYFPILTSNIFLTLENNNNSVYYSNSSWKTWISSIFNRKELHNSIIVLLYKEHTAIPSMSIEKFAEIFVVDFIRSNNNLFKFIQIFDAIFVLSSQSKRNNIEINAYYDYRSVSLQNRWTIESWSLI